jgi:hypothetical protein
MNATRLKSADGLVRLQLPKGVLLILTPEQYVAALQRGKAERRQERRRRHHERLQARQEAATLAWLRDEENDDA